MVADADDEHRIPVGAGESAQIPVNDGAGGRIARHIGQKSDAAHEERVDCQPGQQQAQDGAAAFVPCLREREDQIGGEHAAGTGGERQSPAAEIDLEQVRRRRKKGPRQKPRRSKCRPGRVRQWDSGTAPASACRRLRDRRQPAGKGWRAGRADSMKILCSSARSVRPGELAPGGGCHVMRGEIHSAITDRRDSGRDHRARTTASDTSDPPGAAFIDG